MKKNYKLLIVFVVFFVTGCSANYNIEIYNDKVIEKVELYENNILNYDMNVDFIKSSIDYYNKSDISTYEEIVNKETKRETYAFIESNDLYHKKKLINKDNMLGVRYLYTFNITNYKKSYLTNSFYKYFSILDSNDKYILSTSNSVDGFEKFSILDNLTIHLKTNHKVTNNNADSVDGYNYYWYIDSSNADGKSIYIELYKDKYIFNYEHKIEKILIVTFSIAFLLFIVIIILRKRAKKSNSI